MTEYEKSERITPLWKIKIVKRAIDNMIREEDIDTGNFDCTLASNSLVTVK